MICSEGRSEIWASNDGTNFTQLHSNSSEKIIAVSNDTHFIKVKPKGSLIDKCVVIHDLAYGPELSDVVEPELLIGTYKADDQSYTEENGQFRFRFNVPVPVTDRTVRYFIMSAQNSYHIIVKELKIWCKSGKVLTDNLFIDTNGGSDSYLLPLDAESVEVSFSVTDQTIYDFKIFCKGFTYDISNKALSPSSYFEDYFDIDGDGMLENIVNRYQDRRVITPVSLYDGSVLFLSVSSQEK